MPAETRQSNKPAKLPFYLVCDVSYSMADEGRIDAVNEAIGDIKDALRSHPILADVAYMSVIDFSDDSRLIVPMGNFSEGPDPEPLTVRGGTNYSAAFRRLRQVIAQDVARLKANYKVYRPAVFFLSDGEPTDSEWPDAFGELTRYDRDSGAGFEYHPLFVPFGIGEADRRILAKLAYPAERSRLYMANEGSSTAEAVHAMAKAMLLSMLSSSRTVAAVVTGPGFPPPTARMELPGPADVPVGVSVYSGHDLDVM